MVNTNLEIREKIKCAGVKFWEVADRYGISDGNFSRKLRRELADEEKVRIYEIINGLTTEKNR
jgi:hypothetical protein